MIADYDAEPTENPEARTAPGEDDDAFLRQVRKWFDKDRDHSSDWRKEAKEDYDFAAGAQWSEDDKATLRDQMRPVITFNRIAPTIESVIGLEIGNRREVRYIPRTQGDAKPNEILTSAAEWVRDECHAEDEETDAFFDCVVCGMGWTETRLDYEEDAEGKLIIDRLDPLEMYWDGDSRKGNLADARRIWRVRTMSMGDARALLPEADPQELDASWARGESTDSPHDADPENAYQDEDRVRNDNKEITIVQLQWWEREPFYRVAFNGRIEDVAEADFATFEQRARTLEAALPGQFPPMKATKQYRRKYQQAFIGKSVLSRGPSPCEGHFSWEAITGKRDHNKGTWYGLVRGMKDPQRWANKWLSQSLHILNSNAKGGIFAERDAFDDIREAEETYARADRITWVKPGANQNGKIVPKPAPTFPAGFDALMQFAITSIRDVSGVNNELLGLRDSQQSGVLEEHRKQAGMTILAGLFDSLRRYRKRQGRVLLYYITRYLSDGRLIRIVGEEGQQYVPLIREPGVVQYDVIVDDQANSPNQKEKVWQLFQNLLPVLGQTMGPEEWLTMLEFSPFPTSVVEKLKAGFKEKQEAAAPKQQAMEQAQMAMLEAQIRKVVSEALKNENIPEKTASEVAENEAQAEKIGMETVLLPLQHALKGQEVAIKARQAAKPQQPRRVN